MKQEASFNLLRLGGEQSLLRIFLVDKAKNLLKVRLILINIV